MMQANFCHHICIHFHLTISADLVIWDSHPLALGSTPVQVYIDGIRQIDNPAIPSKPESSRQLPKTPDWEKEIKETLMFDGIPPLEGRRATGTVQFIGVKSVWTRGAQGLQQHFDGSANSTVVVRGGRIACLAEGDVFNVCQGFDHEDVVDLEGGSLAPGLTSFGSKLGLSEIQHEPSTMDGPVFDPLTMRVPDILGNVMIRAVDGLQFGGRHSLYVVFSANTMSLNLLTPRPD
jgi:hypothetical protein